jgi:hypothetical protein
MTDEQKQAEHQQCRCYQHPEAFCLMLYQCKGCGFQESLWNSRDGVTPFGICCPKCGSAEMFHVEWHRDTPTPFLIPPPNLRVFVDMTPEASRAHWEKSVESYWDTPSSFLKQQFETKAQAIAELSKAIEPGAPDIITGREYLERNKKGHGDETAEGAK